MGTRKYGYTFVKYHVIPLSTLSYGSDFLDSLFGPVVKGQVDIFRHPDITNILEADKVRDLIEALEKEKGLTENLRLFSKDFEAAVTDYFEAWHSDKLMFAFR